MNEGVEQKQVAEPPDRWTLIRDVAVFQVKLLADGLRDVVLVPVSLVAGIVSLLSGRDDRPGTEFYELLSLGRRSERWINLFGAAGRLRDGGLLESHGEGHDMDALMDKVETFLVDEYRKGGITAHAKDRLDRMLDSVKRVERRPPPPEDGAP